ncbi:MAG: hypothetical protein K6A63_03080 [Acholeplasmatales bacterium]|nr:hypothetical protein [Acholeplasmatales bacterium]
MNFLTKHSKAFYYAYGILIAVVIIAGLFYASQYADIRVLFSVSGDSVSITKDTTDTLNRTNKYVYEYFENIANGDPYGFAVSGFSSTFGSYAEGTYAAAVYDFQVKLSNVNSLIINLGLCALVCFALLLVLSNHSRRIYYKSNLIGGILLPVFVIVLMIVLMAQNLSVMGMFNDNKELFNIVSLLQGPTQIAASQTSYAGLQAQYSCTTFTFILFTILFIIVIAYSVFMAVYAYLKYKATAEERAEIEKKAVANND